MPIPLIPYDASLRQGTEYLNQAITQANASELVRQQALEAIALTNTATSAANTAASTATTEAGKATTSATAANAAATSALAARDGANTAKAAADTATGNANTATTQANTARDAANTAKTNADTAASNANAKAALANTAAGTANTAADRANTAASNVEGALADGPVITVNGMNGAVELSPVDIGAEPAGALQAAIDYADTNKVAKVAGKDLFSGAYADLTGKPTIPALNNTVSSTATTEAATANAVKTAYDRADAAFQSASSGKTLIANAITGKGTAASGTDSFATLANAISSISTGSKVAVRAVTVTSGTNQVTVSGLDFRPRIVFGMYTSSLRRAFSASSDGSMPNKAHYDTSSSNVIFTPNATGFTAAPEDTGTHLFGDYTVVAVE